MRSTSAPRRDVRTIEKIIDAEVRLESERRGGAVARHDAVVRENVCRRLLNDGRNKGPRPPGGAWVFTELTPLIEEAPDWLLQLAERNAAA